MAVKRIVENENRIVFSGGGSYIVNDQTGDKLRLRENGKGSYLMDVEFAGGGKGPDICQEIHLGAFKSRYRCPAASWFDAR